MMPVMEMDAKKERSPHKPFTSHCLDKPQQEIKPFCPKIFSTVLLRSSLFLIGLSLVCLTMSMYIYMVLKCSAFIRDK